MLYNVPLRHLFPNISLYMSEGEMSSESRLAGRMPCARRPRPQRSPPAPAATAPAPRAPAPSHALTANHPLLPPPPPRRAHPSLTLLRSLIYPPFLSHPPRTALHPSRATRTSPAPRRALTARTPAAPSEPTVHAARAPVVLTAPARLPAGFLKLRAFSFFAKQFKL